MFRISASSPDLRLIENWVGTFDQVVNDPRIMSYGVKPIGQEMDKVFNTEGQWGGRRWQNLTEMTKDVREQRGYPREHPILQQSGILRAVTAGSLRRYTGGNISMAARGLGVTLVAKSQPRLFTAQVSGAKVQNNNGGTLGAGMHLPQRRFFGITAGGADKASKEIVDRIMREWSKKSSKVRVV